ncbi:MAG: hypothetical protein WC897_05225 [Candidatus Gracilibacteria bacterium]
MKKFLLLILVITGCGSNGLDESAKMIATASSEVDGRGGYFAVDGDSDTFWCVDEIENTIPVLTVILPEEKSLKNVTFMPGPKEFGRPNIVEVWYDSQAEALGELHFTDTDGEQSFEMPEDAVTAVKFKFMRSFAGTYGNAQTCVAEIDFD